MKQSYINKIEKVRENFNIDEILYDKELNVFSINGEPVKMVIFKATGFYKEIKKRFKFDKDKDTVNLLIEYCISNDFISDIRADKAIQKQAEKEAKEEAKKQEAIVFNQKREEYFKNLNVEDLLKGLPKNLWRGVIISNMEVNDVPMVPADPMIKRALVRMEVILLNNKKNAYNGIDYSLTDKNVPEDIPSNYEKFYNYIFKTPEEWNELDDKQKSMCYCCYYDTWKNELLMYNQTKKEFESLKVPIIRNIVREFSPLKNIYIVNDTIEPWVETNRQYVAITQYFDNLKEWDGNDILGLYDESKDNLILEVLGCEQNSYNKHVINYFLIHAYRMVRWGLSGGYNFQHLPVICGPTNCGKTKTMSDLFTFNGVPYATTDLDINANDWTIAPLMQKNMLVCFSERKGIDKASNNKFKEYVDKLNGTIQYQPKGKNEIIRFDSHNVAAITTNDEKYLNDFSVEYEKRYWCLDVVNMTEKLFKDKYLYVIKENHEQIWAEIKQWAEDNQDIKLLDITDDEKEYLKKLQQNHKTITDDEIINEIDWVLNRKMYIVEAISHIDQIDAGERYIDRATRTMEWISDLALRDYFRKKGKDSRFIDTIFKKKLYEKVGWKRVYQGQNKYGTGLNKVSDIPTLF